ncbi:murein hydrolase activator EnvC [Tropicimonas sp. IMCC6043]|uniref:murein hydrolase activator EnvC family protein n=1 Tax=Tropicimonas sp. IMCC6043 TaxID=2510645 RepID=UPI00101DE082|nr:peptidoglycan DD-metalloendopeptidase family protein [Tropicimonas sp. IMCC6043]RYH08221.1 peptidase M23 [Tropicimonas sp. IMCC6043]
MIHGGLARAVWLAATLLAAPAASAETGPVQLAEEAIARIEAASASLEAAEGARDRVRALTETVQAYEEGLAALRAGMRQAAREERILSAVLEAREVEVAQFIGALAAMGRAPAPLLLLHPAGPLGTARSGMLASEIAPEIDARAEELRNELRQLAVLRALQESAAESLQSGMQGVQDARTALSRAMAERTDLPRRFTADPEAMRQLLETADSLESFAAGLTSLGPAGAGADDFLALKGALTPPVQSILLRGFNEPDAAGVARPGWLLATRPGALVTAPAEGTIRYLGPLLDYGNVMILEPADGILLVLAGLGIVYGAPGDVVQAGAPLGLMGGAPAGEFVAEAQVGGGAERSETLYMELRQGEVPVDPAAWFAPIQGD